MHYVFLVAAIATGLSGTIFLKVASANGPKWYGAVAASYITAFTFLGASLRHGMPLGVAYGIWAASDVALVSVASSFLFNEKLSHRMITGIGLIVLGVAVVEAGAHY